MINSDSITTDSISNYELYLDNLAKTDQQLNPEKICDKLIPKDSGLPSDLIDDIANYAKKVHENYITNPNSCANCTGIILAVKHTCKNYLTQIVDLNLN